MAETRIRSYRDLRVWRGAMDLAEQVCRQTEAWPREELYGLTTQVRRSAVSIPSNVAEGHAREHTREYLNFLSFAQGSLAELETQLELANRLSYLAQAELTRLQETSGALGKQLHALRDALRKKLRAETPSPQPLAPSP